MYILRIKNRADQQLTEMQGLGIIKMLAVSKGGMSLIIDGVNIGYFQCSDIRVEKISPAKNQFDKYEKNSEAYWKNHAEKEEWTKKELAKLTSEQMTKLLELCLYMYPTFATGNHGKVGMKKMGCMLLRYVRKCPHDRSINRLFFKPIHGYSEQELIQRFGAERENMDITLTGVMPEKDVSFLSI